MDCLRKTVQQRGVAGLFRGTSSTIYREVPAWLAQFYVYEKVKLSVAACILCKC